MEKKKWERSRKREKLPFMCKKTMNRMEKIIINL